VLGAHRHRRRHFHLSKKKTKLSSSMGSAFWMNYLRDLFRFRTWSLIGVVLFFFGQKMADVWYEPKTESKHNPFSFDECIGLMIDTVQVCILSLFEWLLVHHFVCSPTPDNPQHNKFSKCISLERHMAMNL
jgi:hypothetical protein